MLKQVLTVLVIILGLSGTSNKAKQNNMLINEKLINDSLNIELDSMNYSKDIIIVNKQVSQLDSLLIQIKKQ